MSEVELYKPRDYQKQVHDAITEHIATNKRGTEAFKKRFVVKSSRQTGKTMLVINEMLRFSMQFNRSKNDYLAPVNEQSDKFYEDFIEAAGELVRKTDKVRHIITMINGSKINCHSAMQKESLRGFTTTGLLVIDECIAIPNDIITKFVMPWVDAHKALTLAISTPLYRQFWFYDWYIKGMEPNINTSYKSFDFTNFDLSMVRTKEDMEEKRGEMAKSIFNAEYRGMFIDFESAVFGDYSNVIGKSIPKDFKKLYIGIDWSTGSGKDDTVITGVNEDGKQVFIEFINNMNPTDQIAYINKLLSKLSENYKIEKIVVEYNSIGSIYYDMLKKDSPYMIEPFVTTNESKRNLVDELTAAIENGRIEFLNNEILLAQLLTYEAKINKSTNTVSYNARTGSKDDAVISTMLAWKAYLDMVVLHQYNYMIIGGKSSQIDKQEKNKKQIDYEYYQ